ncbi:e3 ubiquitin-protein ligase SHPRH [Caerostris darwini]|uniref:E3 ubiquitin-protein ligase SHPRH n=1 Tax=Caerostris darwini TaxID=1538125 RepID=A0AAV4MCJ5_9ARAC|nr:e3 ubiquitin-protein ligase SHPRH [Caerostris darwini]
MPPKKKRRTGPEILGTQIENFDKSLKILVATEDQKYCIGNFRIYPDSLFNFSYKNTIRLHFKKDSTEIFLWCEEENEDENEVKFSSGRCALPFEVLNALSGQNQFNLFLYFACHKCYQLYIGVNVSTNAIVSLSNSSEPNMNRFRTKVITVVEHFHGIYVNGPIKEFKISEEHMESIYTYIENSYDANKETSEISHPSLIPKLRKYQSQAVHWMLEREVFGKNVIENVNEGHVLYSEINFMDECKLYYHIYGGFFVTEKFLSHHPARGGILADEMGLGKTVEILACILLHPRQDVCTQEKKDVDVSDEEDLLPSELNNDLDEHNCFECVCGTISSKRKKKRLIKCKSCGLSQHAECVLSETNVSFKDYLCPYCWVDPSKESLLSRATLIVSPFAILNQWEQEIEKHIRGKNLKVFTYHGVEHHKFICPKILADNDIVLASYETFRRELSHVNVPYGENGRPLRYPKKFRTLPTPLQAIEWWRICLDEAQMVESVMTRTSQMALQLKSVNRWCVTGTPIQKSIEDLYGLLLFLGYDPYNVKLWWREALLRPFICGYTDQLTSVLKDVIWRTPRENVLDQLNIPEPKIIVHKVKFTRVEILYYEKLLTSCEREFKGRVDKYNCKDKDLETLDRSTLSKILAPLKKLQKAACHFQLVGEKFSDIHKNKKSLPELLQNLLKAAAYECQEEHRKLIMSINGAASIRAIQEDYKAAYVLYKNVLNSVEEYKKFINTDIYQQIHALHNISEVLSLWITKADICEIAESIRCNDPVKVKQDLKEKSVELSENYLQKFRSQIQDCRGKLEDCHKEINQIKNDMRCLTYMNASSGWWSKIISDVALEGEVSLIESVKDHLMCAPGRHFLPASSSIINNFTEASGLTFCLVDLFKQLHEARGALITVINNMFLIPEVDLAKSAKDCHLRPAFPSTKCICCRIKYYLDKYESNLFRMTEEIGNSNEQDNDRAPTIRKGSHADSELEYILKFLCTVGRNYKDLEAYVEDGINELKIFYVLKKEAKQFRNLFIAISTLVNKMDELAMAKISLRLPRPGEIINDSSTSYIIEPDKIEESQMEFDIDTAYYKSEFKKKLGQLFYLRNLEKIENKEGPFEECCPVCRMKFDNLWAVLRCGHCLCFDCVKGINMANGNSENIRCAVCRGITPNSDIYYYDIVPEPEKDINFKGSYTSKITSVVKCLLRIQKDDNSAKSLIFSSWPEFLALIEPALVENKIPFVNASDRKCFQEYLQIFKRSPSINVMLAPLRIGSDGLNIIEATHVLLVEPILYKSKALQAIGRVYRMGQTRQTTIHKFVNNDTIEEYIHLLNNNDLLNESPEQLLNVQDLLDFFT